MLRNIIPPNAVRHARPSLARRPAGRLVLDVRGRRNYADIKKVTPPKSRIGDSTPALSPGSASLAASGLSPPPPPGPIHPLSDAPNALKSIASDAVPRVPPPPGKKEAENVKSPIPPPPPPPPTSPLPIDKPKRKPRRFRSLILKTLLLAILGYAGGVYGSLVSDNFHDFFTEYVPFGEETVLYFEEREFRKRLPATPSRPARETGKRVTIPGNSGISWKVSDQSEDTKKGRHNSAIDEKAGSPTRGTPSTTSSAGEEAKKSPQPDTANENAKAVEEVNKTADPAKATGEGKIPQAQPAEIAKESAFKPPSIDLLNIKGVEEPVIQDLVQAVNEIIVLVNADDALSKMSSSIESAQSKLSTLLSHISALKESEMKKAEQTIRENNVEFDKAAKELIRRLQEEMQDQETRWKEEFETEREKISSSYQEKLQNELQQSREIFEQRLRNELLEQSIAMKREFISELKDRVENERSGRLGKLEQLSGSVSELERLTAEWNSVVESNLKTQHLHIAVEAIRTTLEKAEHRKPFVGEIVALKEIAGGDHVVEAALASIKPSAYHKGIPTSAQLLDRFRRVSSEVRKASLLPENAGIVSQAASVVLSKVLFKKKGLALGNDVESILTRTELLLEEGDLDGAAREVNGLTGWAKTLSRDWLTELRSVLEVRQALDVIATEARLQSLSVG
ncbi:MAG: Formation of crista junctions protein 1 [Trizodia sp. TS-e1964]|nr:MAG: Formation of crista junctions protein 1 [Trizodia sp. TS-e1964]